MTVFDLVFVIYFTQYKSIITKKQFDIAHGALILNSHSAVLKTQNTAAALGLLHLRIDAGQA